MVIAVGNCPLGGGPFKGSPVITPGLDSPHPLTNLHALLNFFK
jgi:NADH:ubiquinone oxidoreductase subunit B-like Fe-S oxidoreductase